MRYEARIQLSLDEVVALREALTRARTSIPTRPLVDAIVKLEEVEKALRDVSPCPHCGLRR